MVPSTQLSFIHGKMLAKSCGKVKVQESVALAAASRAMKNVLLYAPEEILIYTPPPTHTMCFPVHRLFLMAYHNEENGH